MFTEILAPPPPKSFLFKSFDLGLIRNFKALYIETVEKPFYFRNSMHPNFYCHFNKSSPTFHTLSCNFWLLSPLLIKTQYELYKWEKRGRFSLQKGKENWERTAWADVGWHIGHIRRTAFRSFRTLVWLQFRVRKRGSRRWVCRERQGQSSTQRMVGKAKESGFGPEANMESLKNVKQGRKWIDWIYV